jgi:hypothetical protein
MNASAGAAEIRHIFAALWPREGDARLVENTANCITSVDNAMTQA